MTRGRNNVEFRIEIGNGVGIDVREAEGHIDEATLVLREQTDGAAVLWTTDRAHRTFNREFLNTESVVVAVQAADLIEDRVLRNRNGDLTNHELPVDVIA